MQRSSAAEVLPVLPRMIPVTTGWKVPVKAALVWIGIRELAPRKFIHWLINALGLRAE